MSQDDAAKEQRRAARRGWPIRRYRLGEEPIRDPLDRSSPEERLASMWPLAVEIWTVAGRALPDYSRSEAPGKVIRREEE